MDRNQHLKIPHLRNLYQKVGMFGMAEIEARPKSLQGLGQGSLGDLRRVVCEYREIRSADSDIPTTVRSIPSIASSTSMASRSAGHPSVRHSAANMADLMISFPSDLAPIVGQQITLTSSNAGVANPRIDLLIDRAEASFTPAKILGWRHDRM